ncbi:transmembrane 4 L6 family member 5 isoform X3 [Zalophus californianus]|uniref:Transmembrane 4 L6 family member 5 isoform X3 n=1 Tax=Zalophus californianus TaxID=9704 RepID=A0A6J2FQ64_ZALCA|nr:transmembrane 4 L6 family member 5 isoform X3 [Zalophus californianus]
MCTGKCSRFVGLSLIPLSLICILANALLLVPQGKTTWTNVNQLSIQVWLMAGFFGGGLMMLRSIFSSAFGVLGAIYCLSVSGAGLRIGPKCLTDRGWDYHFRDTKGSYLQNRTLWNLCVEPPGVVSWNVTLFSLLVAASCLEIVLCGVQLVNATLGVFCGDCRKEGTPR